jgi:hypothetical protein
MNTPRRSFLRTATLTAFGAAVAAGSSRLAFGQNRGLPVDTEGGLPVGTTSGLLDDGTEGFPIPLEAQKDIIFYSSYSTFAPYEGGIFTARGASGAMLELKLLRVTQYVPQANTKITTGVSRYYTDSCSLMFRATGPLPSFSSITSLHHAALGKLDLFLTPHGQDPDGFYYEAVINHITSTPPLEFR